MLYMRNLIKGFQAQAVVPAVWTSRGMVRKSPAIDNSTTKKEIVRVHPKKEMFLKFVTVLR